MCAMRTWPCFLKSVGQKWKLEKMARIAEQYIDAHGCAIGGGAREKRSWSPGEVPGPSPSQRPKLGGLSSSSLKGSKDSERKPVVCFLCNKVGQYARECTGSRQPHQRATGVYVQRYNRGRQWGRTDEGSDSEKGAACQIVKTRQRVIEKNVVGDRLKLASGETVPIVLGACDKQSHQSKVRGLPVCRGQVGDKQVQVLRDTGCSSAAIRSDLVRPEQLTGDVHLCRLIDGTLRRFPIARVRVDTPYLAGEIEAMCMQDPIYDLIIGNLPGVTDAEGSSEKVSTDPEESVTDPPSAVAQAVMTRSQCKKAQKDLKPLVVVDMPAGIQNLSVEQVVQAQEADESLAKVRELAETGERMLTRGRHEYQFLKDGGVLYRKCEQPKGAKGRTFQVGEKALVLLPTDRNKLLLQWRGPYEITRMVSGQDYGVSVDGRRKSSTPTC